MKIGLVPLDTRPCTYDFPVQLARVRGGEILLPPPGILRHYREAGDCDAMGRWLLEAAGECDALVVSAEQLLQGGLIASREGRVPLEVQLARLAVLAQIKQRHPALRLYLSTVLMRTTVSALGEESARWWELVAEYSRVLYRETALRDADAAARRQALEAELPDEVLKTFLYARKVSHEVNRACVRLCANGTVDTLLVLQEDCAEEGIQKAEQQVLAADIAAAGVGHRAHMFNGTDEAGAELVQLALRGGEALPVRVEWLWPNEGFVARYEDRPFAQNLAGHMAALHLRPGENARQVLFVLPPKHTQNEAAQYKQAPGYTKEELAPMAARIAGANAAGKQCYLLDVDYANGGNPLLLEAVAARMPLPDLCGYAAWNTASNALGTLLAQLMASVGGNSPLNRAFTTERVLDDCVYQTIVRQRAAAALRKKGQDTYNLTDIPLAHATLEAEFKACAPLLQGLFGEAPAFTAALRWPRLFEAAIFTGTPVYEETTP